MLLMSLDFRQLGTGALLAFTFLSTLSGAPLLTEDFTNVPTGLTGADWVIVNNSDPLGTTSWFQGDTGFFVAQGGATDSYAAANFNAADFGGDVSLFLISPVINYVGDVTVSFWTRTSTGGGDFGDNLQLLFNPSNTTNVGGTASSVGDFTLTLYTSPGTYPEDWTLVTANATLAGPSRFALRYGVSDTSISGNYVGIDSFSIDADVPEPGTYVISSIGLLALALLRRRGV